MTQEARAAGFAAVVDNRGPGWMRCKPLGDGVAAAATVSAVVGDAFAACELDEAVCGDGIPIRNHLWSKGELRLADQILTNGLRHQGNFFTPSVTFSAEEWGFLINRTGMKYRESPTGTAIEVRE